MRTLRVFPERTSFTPSDNMVYIGLPDMFVPDHDEVHISCVFTWDREYCRFLKKQWEAATDKPVLLGGPAFDSPAVEYVPGRYTASNVTFTSRGCNNNCKFCMVPRVEGKLKEIKGIHGGHVGRLVFAPETL